MTQRMPTMNEPTAKPNNLRTALVLASVAAAFFIGIMLKYFLFK